MGGEVVRCDAQGVTSVRRLHAKIVINRFPASPHQFSMGQ